MVMTRCIRCAILTTAPIATPDGPVCPVCARTLAWRGQVSAAAQRRAGQLFATIILFAVGYGLGITHTIIDPQLALAILGIAAVFHVLVFHDWWAALFRHRR